MIQFPLPDGLLCVVEPGNLDRLKSGKPITIHLPGGQSVMVAYTPDAERFTREVAPRMPISTEQLAALLTDCLKWPEVKR